MINRFLNHFVGCFGFECTSDFNSSFIHSNFLIITIPVAAFSSMIENFLGLHGLTVLAFTLLVILELITGIVASKNRGEKIVSHKFSRFGLKVFVWLTLLFITNSLRLEYEGHKDLISVTSLGIFTWLHDALFVYVTVEYLISVFENINSLTKTKSKKKFIDYIIDKLKNFSPSEKEDK